MTESRASLDSRGAPTHTRIALLVIIAATLLAFSGTLQNGFLNWDDDDLIVHHQRFRGLDGEHLRWMFTTGMAGHYQPLTWVSYAVESQLLWGVNAAGFHLTNVLLHATAAAFFFFVARRLIQAACADVPAFRATLGAGIAALLFAVHPLRVESVAWATERRDVLCAAWLVPTVLCYLKAVASARTVRWKWIIGSVACYVMSLLSKASGMTLPAVLLLLDAYPLKRFGSSRREGPRGVLLEKLWFLAPAVGAAAMALWAQSSAGALRSLTDHPFALRVMQACYGILFYLGKTIWPVNLVPIYEQRPDASAFDPAYLLSAAAVVGVSIALWILRRRKPSLLYAWATYIVLLSPVLGFAQSGPQLVADRYSYFSCLPWAILLGGAVAATNMTRTARRVAVGAVGLVFVCLLLLTRDQVKIWRDSYSLWSATVERRPNTPLAHANLAAELNLRGEFALAREHAQETLRRLPGNRTAHAVLARADLELGDLDAAVRHGQAAIEIADHVGRVDTDTRVAVTIALTRLERFDEAEQLYRDLIRLEPSVAQWRFDLGGFLASLARYEEARAMLEEAIRLDPAYPGAALRIGVVLLNLDAPQAAVQVWTEALMRIPDDVDLRAQLAWVLATSPRDDLRDGPRALTLARAATADSGGKSLRAVEALAAALAETGDFPAAVAALEEAINERQGDEREALIRRFAPQLDLYRRGKPHRVLRSAMKSSDPW